MKKGWKYRLLSGVSAMLLAGAIPMASYADEENTVQEQAAGTAEEDPALAMETAIDQYFAGSVFTGDSVMMGFRNYAMNRRNTYLGGIQFLASGSFSVHNALWPVSSKSVHPVYQGQQRPVWESMGMLNAKRVFMFFGLNDMNMGTLENTCDCYAQVIGNIKAHCPDAEIHIISMTYTKQGKGRGNLNNPNIRRFNELLKQMALANGWGFVDLASHLSDANGDLPAVYCSDNYVHQTGAAYDVWSAVLREYARTQLQGTSPFPVNGQNPQPENEVQESEEMSSQETASASTEENTEEPETQVSRVLMPRENTSQNTGPGVKAD